MPTSWMAVITAGWSVKNDTIPAVSSQTHSQQPIINPVINVEARALPSAMAVASVHIKSGPGLMIRAKHPIMYVVSITFRCVSAPSPRGAPD